MYFTISEELWNTLLGITLYQKPGSLGALVADELGERGLDELETLIQQPVVTSAIDQYGEKTGTTAFATSSLPQTRAEIAYILLSFSLVEDQR